VSHDSAAQSCDLAICTRCPCAGIPSSLLCKDHRRSSIRSAPLNDPNIWEDVLHVCLQFVKVCSSCWKRPRQCSRGSRRLLLRCAEHGRHGTPSMRHYRYPARQTLHYYPSQCCNSSILSKFTILEQFFERVTHALQCNAIHDMT
jgi:hypothetical protein